MGTKTESGLWVRQPGFNAKMMMADESLDGSCAYGVLCARAGPARSAECVGTFDAARTSRAARS